MALLIQVPQPRPPAQDLEWPIAIGAATAALPAGSDSTVTQRSQLKTALGNRTYTHVLRARLAHIPRDLPFTASEITARLRAVDHSPENRERTERELDLRADLTFLERELTRPRDNTASQPRVRRRLSKLWDFLALNSNRIQAIVEHRHGRLGNNLGIFFRSDLPSVYMTESANSSHWEAAALALSANANNRWIIHELTKRPADEVSQEAFLDTQVPLRRIDLAFRQFQGRFQAVTNLTDRLLEWRDALEYYVDLFSAEDIRSFRTPRFISTSSLDIRVIDELAEGLRNATSELRKFLAATYPGGLQEMRWLRADDPSVGDFVRMELGIDLAG